MGPDRGGTAIRLGRHFKPSKASDSRQWKVRLLVEHGFRFQHVYETKGGSTRVIYPATLEDAREPVVRYAERARKGALPEVREVLRSV